jgi:hypothetical protein
MTIELLKVPSEIFEDVDSHLTDMAKKLNEVIMTVNKTALLKDGNLAGDLHILLQTWKKEAEGLREHLNDYGVSKEICLAVSHRLFQCYAEVLETIS